MIFNTVYPNGFSFSREYSFSKFYLAANVINSAYKLVDTAFRNILNTNKVREKHLMLSLTKTYKNNNLWCNYAYGDTGFCIEYDIRKYLNAHPKELLNIVPIIYEKKKPISVFDYLNAALDDVKNESSHLYKIALNLYESLVTKDKQWSGEEEWRVICDDNFTNLNLRDFDCASKIFLGANISETNRRKLLAIAKKLNVKVYQRKLNDLGNDYNYVPVKY